MLIFLFMSFSARENHVRVENYVQNVIANYSAEYFQRIYQLSRNCFEELCHILSASPEMQVRSPEFGEPERVSFEKNGFNHFKISWSCREYQTYSMYLILQV